MLSQRFPILAPLVLIAPLVSGCSDDDLAFSDVSPDASWVVGLDSNATAFAAEAGRGDTVWLDFSGATRRDARGSELFRVSSQDISFIDASFMPNGNTLLLAVCFQPSSFAGAEVCADIDPTAPTQTGLLIELDREGRNVRAATLQNDGAGALLPSALSVDGKGDVHIAGSFTGVVDLGVGPIESTTSAGLFYARLDDGWTATRTDDFGTNTASVSDIATDASGQAFLIGTFSGDASFGGINLTNGPSGQAIFIVKTDAKGEVDWAKHFLGRGDFEARFADDGGIYAYGRGDAPFTSLGGSEVIDGPFATRLSANGDHEWTWRAYDKTGGGFATVDEMGRVVALYTDTRLVKEEVVPPESCWDDPSAWGPECEYQPAEYIHRQVLTVAAPDGAELGNIHLGLSEYGGGSARVVAGPDGSVFALAQPGYEETIDFGTGPFGHQSVLARIDLIED